MEIKTMFFEIIDLNSANPYVNINYYLKNTPGCELLGAPQVMDRPNVYQQWLVRYENN